jgi:hypothetical protein
LSNPGNKTPDVIPLRVFLSGTFAALFFVACAAPKLLEPMAAGAPENVDLSGSWQLRVDSASERHRIDEAISRAAGPGAPIDGRPRRQRRGSSGDLVYVFLETGESLKVTQTSEGMFLSFNRSRVEEFRFGENRMINVGQIDAQRVSGWVGEEYIVKSLDKNGMKLTEKLWLSDGGDTLNREFTFSSKKDPKVVARQAYDRVKN